MAWVNAASSSSAVASGTAGASLTGVTAGHGLVCFVLYQSVATSRTLTDSSGTTWLFWNAINLAAAQVAIFRTTSAVVAGTHTVTASFSGGGNAWTYVLEDDESPVWGAPVGQKLTAPGAGNVLVAGSTIGVTGGSIYQIAIDTSNTALGYQPAGGALTALFTQQDAAIGAWNISTGVQGGTQPGMAPGTSDSGGADNYVVLGMAFMPGGNAIADPTLQPILIKEDVGPEQRSAYPLQAFFFNRVPFVPPSTPLAFLSIKTPPWEFYRDPFTSVYPVANAFAQNTQVAPSAPRVIYSPATKRLDPPEEDLRRFDHQVYFQTSRHYTAQLVGFTVETPDFTDHPWLEWVHPKLDDETALFPYRRTPVITPPGPNVIFWAQPKPWPVTAEEDSVYRKPDVGVLFVYPRPIPPAILMPDLRGLTEADAIAIIVADGLLYLTSVYEDVVFPQPPPFLYDVLGPVPPLPRGIVIDQRPAPGATVQPGVTEVILILSSGLIRFTDVGDSTSFNTPNVVIGSTQ